MSTPKMKFSGRVVAPRPCQPGAMEAQPVERQGSSLTLEGPPHYKPSQTDKPHLQPLVSSGLGTDGPGLLGGGADVALSTCARVPFYVGNPSRAVDSP